MWRIALRAFPVVLAAAHAALASEARAESAAPAPQPSAAAPAPLDALSSGHLSTGYAALGGALQVSTARLAAQGSQGGGGLLAMTAVDYGASVQSRPGLGTTERVIARLAMGTGSSGAEGLVDIDLAWGPRLSIGAPDRALFVRGGVRLRGEENNQLSVGMLQLPVGQLGVHRTGSDWTAEIAGRVGAQLAGAFRFGDGAGDSTGVTAGWGGHGAVLWQHFVLEVSYDRIGRERPGASTPFELVEGRLCAVALSLAICSYAHAYRGKNNAMSAAAWAAGPLSANATIVGIQLAFGERFAVIDRRSSEAK